MIPILRLCDSCLWYNEESNTCKAFPDGIPLRSADTHFEVLPGQEGEYIYEMDKSKHDEFDAYLRLHPNIKVPVIVSYEVPDEDDVFESRDVEIQEVEGPDQETGLEEDEEDDG